MEKYEISQSLRDYEGDELVATYDEIRPKYPDEVREEVLKCLRNNAKYGASQKFMLDVGCGGGISTKLFANDFERILGIDVSQSQIEFARKGVPQSKVAFQVVHDNILPVEDNTTDLIFCGISLHYLNIPVFIAECNRALVPGGLLVCVTYGPDTLKSLDGKIICDYSSMGTESELESLLKEYAYGCGVDMDAANVYYSRYENVFNAIRAGGKRHFEIAEIDRKFTVDEFVKYESTVAGYTMKSYPDSKQDPLNIFREGLNKILQDAGMECKDDTEFIITIKFTAMIIEKTNDFGISLSFR